MARIDAAKGRPSLVRLQYLGAPYYVPHWWTLEVARTNPEVLAIVATATRDAIAFLDRVAPRRNP